MSAKRQTIGRTFSQTSLNETSSSEAFVQKFTLASGVKAQFRLEVIDADKVASDTFVTLETNGREQAALTPESLKDITRTIKLQQFFPAIGRRVQDGIEILDGSRRRAGAILQNVNLNVLVTESNITAADARQLAADIQTAKEHNLREIGLRLMVLRENGLSQKEIAKLEMLSEAKVTRAIQAASVPQELLALFPVQSELNYPDYKFLLNIYDLLIDKGANIAEVLEKIRQSKVSINDGLAVDEVKNEIIQIFRNVSTTFLEKPDKEKVVTKKLWDFEDKDKFARKKSKGRLLSYEFNRVSKDLQDELDSAILSVIQNYYNR